MYFSGLKSKESSHVTLGRGGCLLEERVDARGRGGVGARKPACSADA